VARLTRGGVFLARLDPVKGAEIGKLRPVVVLSADEILEVDSPLLFICPLSSRSDKAFEALHIPISPRDSLRIESYALVEHCRAISRSRLAEQRIAQLTHTELEAILHRLKRLVGF
jgi:mRNA interferase MazF